MRLLFCFFQVFIPFLLGINMNEYYTERLEYGINKTWNKTGVQPLENENQLNADFDPFSMLAFVPARCCHVQFKNNFGTFSPPMYSGNVDANIWCNWTILAGPGKHIVIYIKGFQVSSGCDENRDEIIFEGVSSTVENTVIYACWNKHTHVFATEATAVHVVFFWLSFSHISSNKYFEATYYVFDNPATKLSTAPHNCSLSALSPHEPVTNNISNLPSPVSSFLLSDLTTEVPVLDSSVLPFVFNTVSETNIISDTSEGEFSEAHTDREKYTSSKTNVPISSALKKDELLVHITLESDLITNNVKSTLVQFLSTSYSIPEFMWQTSSYSYESKEVEEMYMETATPGDLESSFFTQETLSKSLWMWEKGSSHWLSETPYLRSSHPPELTLYENVTKTLSHMSTPCERETLVAEYIQGSSLITCNMSSSLSTPHILVQKTSSSNEREKMSDQYQIIQTSEHPASERTEYGDLIMESSTLSWPKIPTMLSTESPVLEPSYSIKHMMHHDFSNIVTTLTTEKSIFSGDLSLGSKHLNKDSISQSFSHYFLPHLTPDRRVLPSTYVITLPSTILSKSLRHDDDIDQNLTAYLLEKTKILELAPHSIVPTVFQTFPTVPSYTVSTQLHSIERDKKENFATVVKSQKESSVESINGAISDKLLLSQLSEIVTVKGKDYPKTMYAHLVPTDEYILEESAHEPLLMTFTSEETKPEDCTQNTLLLNIHHALKVSTSSEISKNIRLFLKQLDNEQQDSRYVHPSRPYESQSTTEWHTAMYLDKPIHTSTLIMEEEQSSTYSYQSVSDFDYFALGQPRSGNLDQLDIIPFFGNKTELGFPHDPGDCLYAINSVIQHNGTIWREMETDLIKSISGKIKEKMVYFPNQSIMLKDIEWKKDNYTSLTFWLHLKPGGNDKANVLKAKLETLANTSNGKLNVTLVSFSVEDVNECHYGIQQCHIQAICVNEPGTYSCHCRNGYKDHSPDAPGTVCIFFQLSGIRFIYEKLDLLVGAIAGVLVVLLIIIAVLCALKQKRHIKGDFSLTESKSASSHIGGASDLTELSNPYLQQSKTTRDMTALCDAAQHTARETSSTLELTKITIEQTAC